MLPAASAPVLVPTPAENPHRMVVIYEVLYRRIDPFGEDGWVRNGITRDKSVADCWQELLLKQKFKAVVVERMTHASSLPRELHDVC
jgi:hypothetical protein